MGDVGSRIREFFSYVAKIVNAKKIRKSSSFAVDRDVPAGAVVAGITQENRESVSQCRKASQSRASHHNCRHLSISLTPARLYLQNVQPKHPPDKEYRDNRPCDVNDPVASCFRLPEVEHAAMVAGPAQAT